MDERESDPTGAFRDGGGATGTEHATTIPATGNGEPVTEATGVESEARERAIDAIAVTSDVADPDAQDAVVVDSGEGTPAS
ncbi:MAG TPA: hypothetical protein VHM48_11315 [Candidatus Limnocylindrales bacterium]|nr:hypothetical protein [Candidatus Limnocylindrales bacterium]